MSIRQVKSQLQATEATLDASGTCKECSHPLENHKDADCETDCQDCLIDKADRDYDGMLAAKDEGI